MLPRKDGRTGWHYIWGILMHRAFGWCRAAKSVKCATTAAPVDAARYPSECMSGSLWFLFQLPSLAKHPRRKNILMMRRRKMRMMTMTMTMAMAMAMTMRMTMTMRMRMMMMMMMMMMRMRILKHVVFCLHKIHGILCNVDPIKVHWKITNE